MKKLVSLIIPVYNEEAILVESLDVIFDYLGKVSGYQWEVILVNDGSSDKSYNIIEKYKSGKDKLITVHHKVNRNLGEALKTGFAISKGKYVITFDLDLSYDVTHIEKILQQLKKTDADLVVASPYMKGGKVTAVPFRRLFYSRVLNFNMRWASQANLKTFTSMVRGYKGDFIRSLNLKAQDYEINPEIVYKAFILRAHIVEMPAHLDWSFQNKKKGRISGIRIARGIISGFMSCFIFRPYISFIAIGMLFLSIAVYIITWIAIHTFQVYPDIIVESGYFDDRFSLAVSEVYSHRPYSFLIAGFVLIVALQFISMGFISLQKKRYFEEGFHVSTTILREFKKNKNNSKTC